MTTLEINTLHIFSNSIDETRQISQYVTSVIDAIDADLEENYEERLIFYSDCRGRFKRLDSVQWRLIFKVISLASSILVKTNQKQQSSQRVRGFFQVYYLNTKKD